MKYKFARRGLLSVLILRVQFRISPAFEVLYPVLLSLTATKS